MSVTPPPLPVRPDPEESRRRFEDEPVGPNDETRAQMRQYLLRRLDKLEEAVESRWLDGTLEAETALKLRLRVHTQRCSLLGLPWGGGEPW